MTEERTITDVVAELERTFLNSGLDCSDADALRGTITAFAALWIVQPSPQPRKVGREKANKELAAVAADSDLLIARIENLSRTAASGLGGRRAMAMAHRLRGFAEDARNAEIVDPVERGRPKNMRAIYAARVVIDAYEATTLCKVDLPADSQANSEKTKLLEPLVRNVFQVIGIEATARAAISAAIAERQQSKRKHVSVFREPPDRHGVTAEQFFERMQQIDAVER